MKYFLVKYLILFLFVSASSTYLQAQIYSAGDGHIWFFSQAPIENIEAHNHSVASALNTSNGILAFKVTMNRFEFEKNLMQKHFNENYLETEKYEYAVFKGQINDFNVSMLEGDSELNIVVSGSLTLHGITKNIEENAILIIKGDTIHGSTVFTIRLEDYKIKIPKAVIKNIAEEVDVHVEIDLTPQKKN